MPGQRSRWPGRAGRLFFPAIHFLVDYLDGSAFLLDAILSFVHDGLGGMLVHGCRDLIARFHFVFVLHDLLQIKSVFPNAPFDQSGPTGLLCRKRSGRCRNCSALSSEKKTGVVKRPGVFDHAGLLIAWPTGRPGLPFAQSSDFSIKMLQPLTRPFNHKIGEMEYDDNLGRYQLIHHWTRGKMKSQGEIEAAICDGIRRFEQEFMGRGPKEIHAHLVGDLLVVRLHGVLTAAEQQLIKTLPTDKGRDLLKQVRSQLVETARPVMESMVEKVTEVPVVSVHHDISTKTGEELVVFTLKASPIFREARKR